MAGMTPLPAALFGQAMDALPGYLLILIMYILIYAFVWISTVWMLRTDEKKINEAINEIRDEE